MRGIDRTLILVTVVHHFEFQVQMNASAALIRLSFAFLFGLVLSACGSGGDSGTAPAPAPVVPPAIAPSLTCMPLRFGGATFSAVADASVAVGKAAGAVLAGCIGAVSNVQ